MNRLRCTRRPSAVSRACARHITSSWPWATTAPPSCSTSPVRTCRTSRTSTRRRTRIYRQRVVIVGGKNSAAEAALEIHRTGGHVTIVHRGAAFGDSIKYWVKPDIENRVKEGSIAAHFNANVVDIRPTEVRVEGVGGGNPSGLPESIAADAVLLLTGYRADPDFTPPVPAIGCRPTPTIRGGRCTRSCGERRRNVPSCRRRRSWART
ncbi:MAG: hypothetical protein EXQ50_07400 [Acidobacteria bacterium]|nr:hypothetical protein [Acidobacteriota bacterium]MSO82221.1 hypothetical protein [Acidobacteriota bacterium]